MCFDKGIGFFEGFDEQVKNSFTISLSHNPVWVSIEIPKLPFRRA